MQSEVDDLIFLCRIYHKQHRTSDAIKSIKKLVYAKPCLDENERVLFQAIYKQLIDSLRNSLATVNSYWEVEYESGQYDIAQFLQTKKEQICEKLIPICKEAIGIIDDTLIPNTNDSQALVFYYKLKGDFYRYVAEYSDETDSVDAANLGEEAYTSAFDNSQSLPVWDSVRLSLVLNAAVFKYEIRKNPDEATEMLESEVKSYEEYSKDISEDVNKEICDIIQLMKQNLSFWEQDKMDDDE